jgi:hypothetical protein
VSPVKYVLVSYIPEDDILHSQSREILKSYIALTGWTLYWRSNVSPVKYVLDSYIPEVYILHSHSREGLNTCIVPVTFDADMTRPPSTAGSQPV